MTTHTRPRIVIKLGTNVLMHGQTKIDPAWICSLAEKFKELKKTHDLILVCSGAAREGKNHVRLTPEEKSKYTEIARRQLYAAVGQPYLLYTFIDAFNSVGMTLGQALLTRNTFSELNRYYNTTAVLNHMLEEGIVPLINGNDVITTLELSAGGNDGLAAIIAIALDATRLVLVTDTEGVYDKNPTQDPTARKFDTVRDPDILLSLVNKEANEAGIGGMFAKIEAARLAWYAGIKTVICNGMDLNTYTAVMDDTPPGTLFIPPIDPSHSEHAKIRWFLSARNNYASVIVDHGAESAVKNRKSLLFVGIKTIKGHFQKNDIISIENEAGQIIACGMVIYDSDELKKMQQSEERPDKPVIHANKMKLLYIN